MALQPSVQELYVRVHSALVTAQATRGTSSKTSSVSRRTHCEAIMFGVVLCFAVTVNQGPVPSSGTLDKSAISFTSRLIP